MLDFDLIEVTASNSFAKNEIFANLERCFAINYLLQLHFINLQFNVIF
jgi:hypothetical protein